MCGINGIFNFDREDAVAESLIHAMRKQILHRGPDDFGTHFDGSVGLGFNRLSIIDLSGGHQPMSNEDGTVWIVFNGEIYNFMGLRDELISKGHQFRTRSDTETIVHAWEEFGERCVDRLRGMFAFTIWDRRRRVLFGARDRMGIKPFYYYRNAKRFAFASELKALLEVPDIPRTIDPAALAEFLRHRYVIAPRTILKDVFKLPPGHSILVSETGVEVKRYWEIPVAAPRRVSERDAIEEFRALLEETLRMHLISDVPLGAFLSGGLDSSAVVGLMHKLGVGDIKTFSIGYDTPESELGYAKIVADHFHTDHHELLLTPTGFRDDLPRIVWSMDEPVGDEASLPLYCLAKFARQKVTVALSGEGSDEILGGYPIYRTMLAIERLQRVPGAGLAGDLLATLAGDGKLRKYAEMLGQPLEERYWGVSRVFPPEKLARLFPAGRTAGEIDSAPKAFQGREHLDLLARMTALDMQTWLPDDLLVKADRMSMAASIELRVPFLDHKVVEFAAALPLDLKIRGNNGKYLLKKSMEGLLPNSIIYRSKKGFPVPTRSWFREDLAGFARETLLANDGAAAEFFDRKVIEDVLASHQTQDQSQPIYALLVFDQWYRMFVKSARPALAA